MDYLREGVHLRSFAQKDPLVEYRSEGHGMFQELGLLIREEVLNLLFHARIEPHEAEDLRHPFEGDDGASRTSTSRWRARRRSLRPVSAARRWAP